MRGTERNVYRLYQNNKMPLFMKKQTAKLLQALLTMLVFATSVHAQISGVTFRDFNSNGVKENTATFNEPFVNGVTVKVTLPNFTSFTTTTSGSGAYSFTAVQVPSGTAVRIEFSGLGLGDFSSNTRYCLVSVIPKIFRSIYTIARCITWRCSKLYTSTICSTIIARKIA